MKRILFSLFIVPFIFVNITGCVPFMVGGAVGALGSYAVSKDTIQGDTDKPYDSIFSAALTVSKIRGTIKHQDYSRGYIQLEADSSRVWIRLIRLTRLTTRLRIASRKYHLPNLTLAQEIFTKIMEEAR